MLLSSRLSELGWGCGRVRARRHGRRAGNFPPRSLNCGQSVNQKPMPGPARELFQEPAHEPQHENHEHDDDSVDSGAYLTKTAWTKIVRHQMVDGALPRRSPLRTGRAGSRQVVQRGIQAPAPVKVRWQWAAENVSPPRHDLAAYPSVPTDPNPLPPGGDHPSGSGQVLNSGLVTRLHDELYARLRHGRANRSAASEARPTTTSAATCSTPAPENAPRPPPISSPSRRES
jgi:hypothetical protein